MILSRDFVNVVSEINLFSHLSDNELVLAIDDLSDSLDILYDLLAKEVNRAITDKNIDLDMYEWESLVYLTNAIKGLIEDIDKIKGSGVKDVDDRFDFESISLIKEYLSYGAITTKDVLFIDTNGINGFPYIRIGRVCDDGCIASDDNNELRISSPVNVAVSIMLQSNSVKKEDLFQKGELEYVADTDGINGEEGYYRIKPNAIINRLGVHRDGNLVSIKDLLISK